MTDETNLSGELAIKRPELWTLHVALRPTAIDWLLYTEATASSMLTRTIALAGTGDYRQDVEEAVYDNTIMLDDYKRVRVVIDTPHVLLVPGQHDDPEALRPLAQAAYPDEQGELFLSPMPTVDATAVCWVTPGLIAFVQRTFNQPTIVPHLQPLIEHYVGVNAASNGERTMFLYARDGRLDMVIAHGAKLLMANSFTIRSGSDAAFMALHAWDSYHLNAERDKLQIAGDSALVNDITPHLRPYLSYVMPTMIPAGTMRLGRNALNAPLDLILQC